ELNGTGVMAIDRRLRAGPGRHSISGEVAQPAICKHSFKPQTLCLGTQKRSQAALILLPGGFSVVAFARLLPRPIDVDADAVGARDPVGIISGCTVAEFDGAGH